jgi:hypothetical protein
VRILIVQIPPQTAEDILTGLKKHIKLTPTLLMNPVDIPLKIPLRISCTQNRHLSLQQLRQRLLPLMRASWVSQSGMEQHKAIQVRIKRPKVLRLVHSMEVIHISSDLHLSTETVLDNSAERILGCALWKRVLAVPIRHTLRPDEDQVQESARVHVLELEPDVAGKRGLSAGAEDEDSHWGRFQAETFDVCAFTCFRGVQGVAEG